MDKEFWKGDGESSRWGYMTDDHQNAITLAAMEDRKNGRLERTMKELSQFDDKKPEDLESEFDHLMWLIRIQLRLSRAATLWI